MRIRLLREILAFGLCIILASASSEAKSKSKVPDHVLVMVFDQMRPDYIERYNLKNFKRLIGMGRNYPNGYVGHSASVTIASHLVLSTGLLPKDLPWADNVMWDKEGILGTKDEVYETTHLKPDQLMTAMKTISEKKWLATKLHAKWDRKVISIGEKDYAAITLGGAAADMIITIEKKNGVCKPSGVNVPPYIQENPRYSMDCKSPLGTENSFYPLDGYHYYPGTDPSHTGGDEWTADIALDVIKNENWGALLLTFGAIDRFGHMLGEVDWKIPLSYEPPAHLEDIARVADTQLGRVLDELKNRGILESTIIVATADHGGQTDSIYLGNAGSQTLGHMKDGAHESPKAFWLSRLEKTGKVRLSYADTSIRIWLSDYEKETKGAIEKALKEIFQVTRIFQKVDSNGKISFREVYSNLSRQSSKFKKWAMAHDQELVNTMASPSGPDYVALLVDNAGFGKLGDHGGNQEMVQRIPMIWAGPGVTKGTDNHSFRLVDVAPQILKLIGIKD